MKEIHLVVADLAGTTVKDTGAVANAFSGALAEHGIQVSPDAINAVRGASKRAAIASLLFPGADAARADAVYATFKDRLERAFRCETEPVAGAVQTFAWLRAHSIKLALNTGFDRDITALLIDVLGWRGIADAVICGDDVTQGRPAPYMIFRAMEATATIDVRHVLNVGDTVSDLHAAHHAGVAVSVGVLSGAHRREQLASTPHGYLIESIADLPDLWR